MRKIFKILLFFSLMFQAGFAQDTIRVAPNYTTGGELNAAIAANGPNKVYLLEADGYYTLNATLELLQDSTLANTKFQIVGAKPKNGQYMPVLQTGNNAEGLPFDIMFKIGADVTIKNIFVANQTTQGQLGNFTVQLTNNTRFEMDGCVVDPVGTVSFIVGGEFSKGSKVYITNNKILRQGDPFSPGGGHLFSDVYADTMYVENNSIVSSDNTLFATPSQSETGNKINFLWFNHNTVAFHDVGIKSGVDFPTEYIVNNLFYDLTSYPQIYAWGAIDADYGPKQMVRSLTNNDTLEVAGVTETLPSQRISFWNRNGHYVTQAMRDHLLTIPNKEANQPHLYVFPLIWNDEMPSYYASNFSSVMPAYENACRENTMYNSASFPKFVEANTFYDMNPGFVDPRIENFATNNAKSSAYWFRNVSVLKGKESLPTKQESSFWDVDGWAGTTAAFYPTVWPRWNGKYTNPLLLTASNAGLPLGDLNEFPEAKALWERNKDRIADHIKSLSIDKISITGLNSNTMESSIRIFPNPITDFIRIEAAIPTNSVKIYNMTGSLVKEVKVSGTKLDINVSDLSKGAYLVEVMFVSGGRFTTSLVK